MDRLSELPDSLLRHILSFMPMRCAVRTSPLSRRWRHIWSSIPDMDFTYLWPESIHRSINFVERSLALHQGSQIRKFKICVGRDIYPTERVNSWISIVASHNVEELYLDCYPSRGEGYIMDVERYKMPHYIFTCRSLTNLTLSYCELNLPTSTRLVSLKIMYLDRVELIGDMAMDLISSSPLLEELTLRCCNLKNDLNIVTMNQLKSLNLIEYDCEDVSNTKFEIFAPNLFSLVFTADLPRISYDVKKLSSLVVASFDFTEQIDDEHYMPTRFMGLLDQIHHVKVLKLCSSCIMNLSIRETSGLRSSVSFSVTTLTLKAGFRKFELPGIAYMLRNFSSLKVLTIDVVKVDKSFFFEEYFMDEYDFDEKDYWKSLEYLFHHISTVKICDFMGSEYIRKVATVEGTLRKQHNEIEFVRVLLKSAVLLETLTIITTKHLNQLPTKSELLHKLTSELLAFPRSSPNAQVRIHGEENFKT